jgi:hypothetical protein
MKASIAGRWRPVASLVAQRLVVTAASPRFWRLRFGIAAAVFCFVTVLLAANAPFLNAADAGEIAAFSRRLAAGLGLIAYLAAITLAPVLITGALHQDRKSGTTDLLVLSPLSSRQILASSIGSPLFSCAIAFVTLVPILALPVYLGGPSILWYFLRNVPAIALAAALSGLYGLSLTVSGKSTRRVWLDLMVFIVITPFAFVNGCLLIVVFLLLAFLSTLPGVFEFNAVVFPLAFPFWSLNPVLTIREGVVSWDLLGCSSALAGSLLLWRKCGKGFAGWLRRGEAWKPREVRSYSRSGGWRSAFERQWPRGGTAPGPEPAEGEVGAGWAYSIARKRLGEDRGLPAEAYLLARRNPFVAAVLMMEGGVAFSLGAFLSVIALFVTGYLAQGENRSASSALVPTLAALFFAAWIAALEAARLMPPAADRGQREALLASPLRGLDVVLGGAVLTFLRFFPVLLAVVLVNALPAEPFGLAAAAGRVLLLGATVAFAYGVSLWASLLLPGMTERQLAGFLTVAGPLAGTAFIWPANAELSHPLALLGEVSRAAALELAAWAAILGGAGLALTVTFALAFRRLATRGC